MKSIFTLASLLVLCLSANAQNWNCDTLINIIKTTNHIQIHTYGNLYNIDDENIAMTYTAHFENIPEGWQFTLDDPSNDITEIADGASANFILSEGVDQLFPEKMIFGMVHNGVPGHGQLIYTIHSLTNPADSIHMVFDIRITMGSPLAVKDLEVDRSFYYAGQGNFHLPQNAQSIKIWNISGKLLAQRNSIRNSENVNVYLDNRQYIVAEIKISSQFFSKKFFIDN